MKTSTLYVVISKETPSHILEQTVFQDYETGLLLASVNPDKLECVPLDEAIEKIKFAVRDLICRD